MKLSAANKEVAEVRSAVDLTADQKQRLFEAKTGKKVELKVIIDPTVLAQVGDTVIDGSVKTRLQQLRGASSNRTPSNEGPAEDGRADHQHR